MDSSSVGKRRGSIESGAVPSLPTAAADSTDKQAAPRITLNRSPGNPLGGDILRLAIFGGIGDYLELDEALRLSTVAKAILSAVRSMTASPRYKEAYAAHSAYIDLPDDIDETVSSAAEQRILDAKAAILDERMLRASRRIEDPLRLALLHKWRASAGEVQEALADDPRDAQTLARAARLLIDIGHFEQAEELLEWQVKLYPEDVQAHRQLADVALRNNDPPRSRQAARAVLALSPDRIDGHLLAVRTWIFERKILLARAVMTKCGNPDPKRASLDYCVTRTMIECLAGNRQQAVTWIGAAEAGRQPHEAHARIGEAFGYGRDKQSMLDKLHFAITQHTEEPALSCVLWSVFVDWSDEDDPWLQPWLAFMRECEAIPFELRLPASPDAGTFP